MKNTKNVRKNYTLYVEYKNNKIKLLSGSMEEIDDFTSYFLYSYAIKRRLSENNFDPNLYIESSKGNRYDLAYYNVRAILDTDNFDIIFEKIKKINPSRIDEYLVCKCNLDKCLLSPNASSIPIVKIHRAIQKNGNYLDILRNYFSTDYKAFRNFVLYFFKSINLNEKAKIIPLSEKEKVLSIIEKAKYSLVKIDESSDITDENDYTDDFVSNIMNNNYIDIDEKKAGIKSKIDSLKNANKDLEHKIDTLNTEIAKCDFAWKNLFANKAWDEIEAKSMDGRFTKKEEKAKQEEPSKEEPKQEKAPAAEKPTVEDVDKPVEPMWTDLQSEEEAKKEEAEQAAKENNEKALVKTSRWSKLWNAIKHPIQTIKAAREKAKSGEGKRIIKNGDAIKKDGEPEKTEAQSVDAFIAKLRQMSEKEAAKDAQNKDNKEQPDYSKYVARHARKVEAQKQRDDEGR